MPARHILKPHNKNLLVYHLVCPVRYRRKVFTDAVSQTLKAVCQDFAPAYELQFLEIGIDQDHVHFLIQTVPDTLLSDMVKKIKSITAKHIFAKHPEVKTFLWGGRFWTSGYYINTVGNASMDIITNYVKNQGLPEYQQLLQQSTLFS